MQNCLVDSSGSSCRFEYEEVFGPSGASSSQKRSQRGLSTAAPTDICDSDSESDSELASCSTSNTHCLRTSPTSFVESNPLSKLLLTDKQDRSIPFDGGCLPLPLLFERRRKVQAISKSSVSGHPPQADDLKSLGELIIEESHTTLHSFACQPSILASAIKVCDKILTPTQSKSTFTFPGTSDYKKYPTFIRESRDGEKNINTARLVAKTSTVGVPGGADYKDCFGSPREPLLLQSPIATRNDQYRAIGPVVRSNEVQRALQDF